MRQPADSKSGNPLVSQNIVFTSTLVLFIYLFILKLKPPLQNLDVYNIFSTGA